MYQPGLSTLYAYTKMRLLNGRFLSFISFITISVILSLPHDAACLVPRYCKQRPMQAAVCTQIGECERLAFVVRSCCAYHNLARPPRTGTRFVYAELTKRILKRIPTTNQLNAEKAF